MMRKIGNFLLFYLLLISCAVALDGVVTVASGSSPRIFHSASELSLYYEKVTGGKLQTGVVPVSGKVNFVLAVPGQGLLPAVMERKLSGADSLEAFWLKTEKDKFYIGGASDIGVLFGVYEFVERQLGVRWLFPGEEGEFYTHRPDFRLQPADLFQSPSFDFRMMLVVGANRASAVDVYRWLARRKMVGHTIEAAFRNPELKKLFMEKLTTFPRSSGHDFFIQNVPEEKYFASHPEYFCLIDGRRISPKGKDRDTFNGQVWGQVCTSNADVVRLCAEGLLRFHDRWGKDSVLLMGMGDNCNVWCQCPECRKLNDPRNPTNHTAAVFSCFDRIARQIYAVRPQADIHAWAYTGCREPVPGMKIDPRMTVLYCDYGRCYAHALNDSACVRNPDFLRQMSAWQKISPRVVMREYLGSSQMEFVPHEEIQAADLKFYYERGIKGWVEEVFPEKGIYNFKLFKSSPFQLTSNWRSRWQMLYMTSRMLWNIGTDWKADLEEANRLYFGRAWPEMKQFRKTAAAAWKGAPGHAFYGSGIRKSVTAMAMPGVQQELESRLADAKKAAAGDPRLAKVIDLERRLYELYWLDPFRKHLQQKKVEIESVNISEKVVIDGKFDETAWRSASWIAPFVNISQVRRDDSRCGTFARIAHNAEGWYLALEMLEPLPDKLRRQNRPADSPDIFKDDTMEIFLISPKNPESFYQIAFNPAGSVYDARWKDGKNAPGFQSGVRLQTRILGDRWQAECFIPAGAVNGGIREGEQWKIHLCRSRRTVQPTQNYTLRGTGFHKAELFTRLIAGKGILKNGGMDKINRKKRTFPGWTIIGEGLAEGWWPGAVYAGMKGTIGVERSRKEDNSVLHFSNGSVFQTVFFGKKEGLAKRIRLSFAVRGKGQVGAAIYRYSLQNGRKFVRTENFPKVELTDSWHNCSYTYNVRKGEAIAVAFNGDKGDVLLDNVNLNVESYTGTGNEGK